MIEQEYVELFKMWYHINHKPDDLIDVERLARLYDKFKKRFDKESIKINPVFVGSINR